MDISDEIDSSMSSGKSCDRAEVAEEIDSPRQAGSYILHYSHIQFKEGSSVMSRRSERWKPGQPHHFSKDETSEKE